MEFQQVVVAYRAGLPNVLEDVSFTIYPGEKVGIVGRTGSGKSTLFLALFRMLELKAGRILLDGVDSQLVGLEELRYGVEGSWQSLDAESCQWVDAKGKSEEQRAHCRGTLLSNCSTFLGVASLFLNSCAEAMRLNV